MHNNILKNKIYTKFGTTMLCKKYGKISAIIVILSYFGACTPNTQNQNALNLSLPNIAATIKTDLQTFEHKKLKKTVLIDTKSETQTIEKPDWEQELSLFLNTEINKPAWQDQYSQTIEGKKQTITAQNDKLIVRKVIQNEGEIVIEKKQTNLLYQSNETLTWQPQKLSYSIVSNRKIIFGNWQNIEIIGTIQ